MVNRNVSNRRWTVQEDDTLLRYVKAHPQNLHKCFLLVSEHLSDAGRPRTPAAVQAHWYIVLSKQPTALCFFTASARHVSKNRKNGVGVETNATIWRKFLRILRLID